MGDGRADPREEEFRAAYVALYPKLYGYLWSLLHDRDAAHEITQETFARLFDRWRRIDDHGAYAYRVATNLARATWRRRHDEHERLALLAGQARTTSLEDAMHASDVRAVVDGLPRRYREVVLLHYYADLPLHDVAMSLNKPLGTVKRQLSEARQLLATQLEVST